MACYYKEVFGLGILGAFFIFIMIILFRDVIEKFIGKVIN